MPSKQQVSAWAGPGRPLNEETKWLLYLYIAASRWLSSAHILLHFLSSLFSHSIWFSSSSYRTTCFDQIGHHQVPLHTVYLNNCNICYENIYYALNLVICITIVKILNIVTTYSDERNNEGLVTTLYFGLHSKITGKPKNTWNKRTIETCRKYEDKMKTDIKEMGCEVWCGRDSSGSKLSWTW